MSTGLECEFIEAKPGEWYYLLQTWDCPVGAWDWREYCQAFGPFPTQDAGAEHLREHHANPGGYNVQDYQEGATLSESEAKAIAEAPANMRAFRRHSLGGGVWRF